jgi:putative sugar O-methyltransferase
MVSVKRMSWDVGHDISTGVWQARWLDKEKHLPQVDWKNFRRDQKLMEGLQDKIEDFEDQAMACSLEKVPLDFCEDSGIGNPEGKLILGRFCTASSLRHARYIHSIKSLWTPPTKPFRLVEIGGGYGGFAAKFVSLFNVQEYLLIDASPCLKVQQRFLGQHKGISHLFSYDSKYPKFYPCDFVISINSLGEMGKVPIEKYFRFIHENLTAGGVFYSNNIESPFFSYPYDERWEFLVECDWSPSVKERLAVRK